MRQTKLLIMVIGVVWIALSLGGCSALQSSFPPSPVLIAQQKVKKQNALQSQCNNADVLLSDLTKPESKRVYSLQPRVVCND